MIHYLIKSVCIYIFTKKGTRVIYNVFINSSVLLLFYKYTRIQPSKLRKWIWNTIFICTVSLMLFLLSLLLFHLPYLVFSVLPQVRPPPTDLDEVFRMIDEIM